MAELRPTPAIRSKPCGRTSTRIWASGIQLAVNTNVIHSKSKRGLSNNDNSGTSPYLVFPFTPSFFNLEPTNGVFPANPFERSNPLQTFSLLQNDEDVWRILGTRHGAVVGASVGPQQPPAHRHRRRGLLRPAQQLRLPSGAAV